MLEQLESLPPNTVIVFTSGVQSWWVLTDYTSYTTLGESRGHQVEVEGKTLYFVPAGSDTLLYHHMELNHQRSTAAFLGQQQCFLLDKNANVSILANLPISIIGEYLGARSKRRLTSGHIPERRDPSSGTSTQEGSAATSALSSREKLDKLKLGDYRESSHGFALSEATPKLINLMRDILRVGDAHDREVFRLERGVPSTLYVPPLVEVPLTKSFSEEWYTEADKISLTASKPLATLTINELARIKRSLQVDYDKLVSFVNPSEDEFQKIYEAVTSTPKEPSSTMKDTPLPLRFNDREPKGTFIEPNDDLRKIYSTSGLRPSKGIHQPMRD